MRTFAVILAAAAVVGLLTGDRRFRWERARLRHGWLFLLGAAVAVAPFLPGLRTLGAASTLARVGTVGGFALLLVGFVLNRGVTGVALMTLGVGLNLAVITANGGRMPVEESAAHRARITSYHASLAEAGPQRHVQAGPATRLAWLNDRIPVVPLGQVVSVGDLMLGAGAAWWLLGAFGSRLVSRHNGTRTEVAAAV